MLRGTDVLRRLPTQMVFDHLAIPPLPAGIAHPSHAIVRGFLDRGRALVKLSGAYINSEMGPPSYPEATAIARDFVKAAPQRLVWGRGSDWPTPPCPTIASLTMPCCSTCSPCGCLTT